jgi:hypothetical protein
MPCAAHQGANRAHVSSANLPFQFLSDYRSGENPARWRGNLDKLLPKQSKVWKVRHHPAMPYAELPGFMQKLRKQEGNAARALEFAF